MPKLALHLGASGWIRRAQHPIGPSDKVVHLVDVVTAKNDRELHVRHPGSMAFDPNACRPTPGAAQRLPATDAVGPRNEGAERSRTRPPAGGRRTTAHSREPRAQSRTSTKRRCERSE